MTARISTFLFALVASATQALAHPGHIAENGHGHDHWIIYVLAICVVSGIIAWRLNRAKNATKAKRRD